MYYVHSYIATCLHVLLEGKRNGWWLNMVMFIMLQEKERRASKCDALQLQVDQIKASS